MKEKKKILLYGVGTFKNKGVEAIINSTINQIDFSKFDVTVASHDNSYNSKFYSKLNHVKHYYKSNELTEEERKKEEEYKNMPFDYNNFELLYQKDVVESLKESDICISVGGDNYCYDYCTWLYALDNLSHRLGKKTVLWGASLFEEINDLYLINDMKNFDVLVIRESITYNAIKKYISKDKILFAPDPAFSLKPKKIELDSWYKNRKIVAINVSPLTIKNKQQEQAIISLINYILSKTKYSVLLLPHVTTDDCNDLDILSKLKRKYKNEERVYLEKGNYDCCELKYIISKCNLLVAARTHASIAAYSTEVPTLVIGYSVKSKGIAKDLFGSFDDYVISKDDLTSDTLIEKFSYINEHQKEIKNRLHEIMPQIKEKSKNLFNDLLNMLNEQDRLKICDRSKCIGCGLCSLKCPHNAISFSKNDEKFSYPEIDLNKCSGCNLCRKCCPINQDDYNNEIGIECYAAKNKNKKEQLKGTSGGIFSVLSKAVLDNNGVVYGAYMNDNKVKHIRIDNEVDLEKIKGSKYIQSSIMEILENVRNDVKENKQVLFSGTPCQIGALKSYFGCFPENLITVSVICHGVMNESLFKKYLNELEIKYNDKIKNFSFRTKDNKWTVSSCKYEFSNITKVVPFTKDSLMNLYINDLVLRESCYDCKFKGKNNCADIIIGDFWGIEVIYPEFLDEDGVSSLIVNTKKASKFLNDIDFFNNTINKKVELSDIVKYNPSLMKSVKLKKERLQTFYELNQNTTELVSLKYNLLNKVQEMSQQIDSKTKDINDLVYKNESLSAQLSSIVDSRRWRMTNKVFNTINKIFRRSK